MTEILGESASPKRVLMAFLSSLGLKRGGKELFSRVLSADELGDSRFFKSMRTVNNVATRDAESPEMIRARDENLLGVRIVFSMRGQKRRVWIDLERLSTEADARSYALRILDEIRYLRFPEKVVELPDQKVSFEGSTNALFREVQISTRMGPAVDMRFAGAVGSFVLSMGFFQLGEPWPMTEIRELVQKQIDKLKT